MRFVSVRELKTKSAQIWRELSAEGEIVVTSNGHPIALLSPVTESVLDETVRALRRARAIEAVAEIQRRSAESGRDRMPLEEIEAEIQAARRSRRE